MRAVNDFIECNPKVMMGKPVVRGTRITVEHILEKLGAGETVIGQTERFAADRNLPGLYRCASGGSLPKPARPRRPIGGQLGTGQRLNHERRTAPRSFIKNASP